MLDAFYPGRGEDNKHMIVPNGINLEKFSPKMSGEKFREELHIPQDSTVIGHTGRFHISKNHTVLLKTFAHLRIKAKDVHLLLIGDGALRDEIENLILELELGKCTTLAGRRKDVPNMLAAMDIFFYPSIYEGLPNALLEAMACGLPIVASNIPEICEIMPRDMSAQLFDSGDIEGFAAALENLTRDACLRKILGQKCRQHAEKNFDLKVLADKLCSCFRAQI